MQHVYTPKRAHKVGFWERYSAELIGAAMLLAVITLALAYVLLLGDAPPEPVASSWSQAPR